RTHALAPRMIGRHAQLQELDAHLQAARGGAGRVVFLAGEAGVGKTRLLRAFIERVRAQEGTDVLQGHCYDGDPAVPYGPFIDALRALVRACGATAVAQAAGPWRDDL